MHVEPPSHAPTNLKELGIHYLMIVVGILTALGLESGIEALHHRRLSHQTIEQVESELQANLADARASLKQNQTALKDLTALTNDVKQLIRDGQAKPAVLEPLLTQSAYFRGHNRDGHFSNLYFVGAGTHPGAGIPGVVASAKATASLVLEATR